MGTSDRIFAAFRIYMACGMQTCVCKHAPLLYLGIRLPLENIDTHTHTLTCTCTQAVGRTDMQNAYIQRILTSILTRGSVVLLAQYVACRYACPHACRCAYVFFRHVDNKRCYLSIHLSIHLAIYPSTVSIYCIHLSIHHPSIHLSIHLLHPSIHRSIYLSTYRSIYLSIYLSIFLR